MIPRPSRFIPSAGKLLAAVPAIACASQAKALIVYTNLNTGVVAEDIYFNLDGSVVSTSNPGSYQFLVTSKGLLDNGDSSAVVAYPGGNSTIATFFSTGDLIDFDPIANGTTSSVTFSNGIVGYLGLAMNVSGQWDYGWAKVESSGGTTVTLYGLAYDNSGAGILAGQTVAVPEPGSAAALAGLVAGSAAAFVARRKRKAAAVAA